MKGSIRKRGDAWSYRFDLGIVDGKRRQKEKGGFRTKKDAEAALAEAMAKFNQTGLVFEPTEVTVSEYLDQWFDLYCVPNLKYNTKTGYRRIIEGHLKPAFGQYRLKALNPTMLQEYATKLKMEGFSKSHVNGIISMFKSALDYAVEPLHYLADNPMNSVKPPKVEKEPRERIILSLEEWEQIRKRFVGTRYEIPLMIGFYTGMRISEAFALTWDDVDFDKMQISVKKQVLKRKSGYAGKPSEESGDGLQASWYFETPKTHQSIRTISIGETLCQALRNERRQQLENELKYGEGFMVHYLKKEKDEKNCDIFRIVPAQKCLESQLPRVRLVCIAKDGQYTSTDSFKYASRIIHHELLLAFDYHSLRHTHATMLFEAGASMKDMQCRLGHANIGITMDTYVHDTEQMRTRTADLFEQIVKPKKTS